ncbi:uncharacterized protein LOC132197210 isoform X2 [Neocloeon triangulifer]|uniref:uncharacterized protein LOC132197210 isoform X2 n=1 Tax=Neocloeon triangulifer TaxID=2078957 RepID=UPI00286EEAE1|nr:uncharacterized protein LOC132197210 isoform X2 [Neocloeon triangulifer]
MNSSAIMYIFCVGICFPIFLWNIADSAHKNVAKVHIKRTPMVVKMNKPSKSTSNMKANFNLRIAQLRRSRIVKCCEKRKCSLGFYHNKKKNNTLARVAKIIRNELNGPSNRLVVIGKKKYKFPPEKATFEEAKKFCEDQGLDLTSPASTKESKSIDEYLNYIGLGSEPLFTAFPTDDSLSGAKWGSDKPPGGPGECLTQYKGSLYNASCDQQSHFSCQEKPLPEGVTQSYDMLASIGDAVLNFVGGKNIIAPSERASVPEATGMCKEKGMDLMSLDSLTQLSSVHDFLGGIGLSSSTLLTSMKKVDDSGSSNWLGDLASALLPPPKNPADQGDCMGISSLGILGVSCDMVSNFVCQAPPPKLIGDNGNELPFSMDLLNMANSLGIESLLEPSAVPESKTTPAKASTQMRPIKTTALPRAIALITTKSSQTTTEVLTTIDYGTVAEETLIVNVPEIVTTSPFTEKLAETQTEAPSTREETTSTVAETTLPTTTAAVTTAIPITTTLAQTQIATTYPTTPLPTTTATTTTPAPIAFEVSDMGRTYFSPNLSLPVANASDWCGKNSARLVLLENKREYDVLYNFTGPNYQHANLSYYTGMNQIGRNWSSFYCDSYASTAFNSINASQCLVIANRTYRSDSCNESRAFICESNKPNGNKVGVHNVSLFKSYEAQLFVDYTFYEARTYCKDRGLELAKIDSRFELLGELKYMIYSLGIKNMRLRVWMDMVNGSFPKNSTDLLYVNWAPGFPDAFTCNAYFNYTLTTHACLSTLYPICENTTQSSKIANDVKMNFGETAYLVSGPIINSFDADIYCTAMNMKVVAVETKLEHQTIVGRLNLNNLTTTYVAVDLLKINATYYVWGNNGTFNPNAVGWGTSRPNGNGDCGAYFNGSLVLVDCYVPKRIFCQEDKEYGNPIIFQDPKNEAHKYRLYPKSFAPQNSLNTSCNYYGQRAVTLDSPFELKNSIMPFLSSKNMPNVACYISSELTGSSAASWKNSANQKWLLYENFNVALYPKDFCLVASEKGTKIFAQNCSMVLPILCEDFFDPPVTNVTSKDKTRPDYALFDFMTYNTSTYFIYKEKGKLYPEARGLCQSFHSDLAIIESKEESDFLIQLLGIFNKSSAYVFIGLDKIDRPSFSHWINNVSLTYSNWYTSSTPNSKDRNCTALLANSWLDIECQNGGLHFICETNSTGGYQEITDIISNSSWLG